MKAPLVVGFLLLFACVVAASVEVAEDFERNVEPRDCPNGCSGNGVCSGTTCACNSGWAGIDCSIPDTAMAPAYIYRNTVYKKQWQYYHIAINSSSTLSFQVNQTVSTQDCDLYVQINSYPTQYNYYDRDISTSASFQITIDPAAVGIWYAGVYGFSDCSYAIEAITALPCPNGCSGHGACNRGVCTCNATWTGLDCATAIVALTANTPLTGQNVGATSWNYYYFNHQNSGTMVFWVNQSSSSQDCDLYINRGTVPTFSSWLYREDSVAQTFSLTIPSATTGYWYAGVYGFTSCTYSIQVNTNTPCTSHCSNHGTCNSNTGACTCNRGFNGTYCQQTSLPATSASTYNGYAAQSLWNYYYVSVNAEDNLIAVVRSYTPAGSCWIYARHNALPTQISYDAASVGNTATNNSLTISQPQGGTWWIGVYGASDCNYTLTGYLSSACPNSCSGHGTCASGTCFCNSGYAGADCSLSLSPLTSNRAVSGSIGMAAWNFYTVSNVLTAFTVHLLETNTVGDIWLFVGQSDLSLTNYEYSSIDSRSANHNIIVPRLSSSAPTSYVIGVYGDPYLCASCTAAYQIVAYLTPW